jgi:hypoxanthine-DNA glycosylase
LILGSFPSVKSREENFYYANPQNRFWKVLSSVFDDDFTSLTPVEKKEKLLKHHIAIYDVITSCDIIGSLDSSIKNPTYLDIDKILQYAKIEKIFLNGNKSYELFTKKFPKYSNIAVKLPSTSPANAKSSLESLIGEWKIIKI